MMKKAFVFPGQGAQKVGMVKDLYDAYPVVKQLFEEADDALGFSLTKLCFEGPDEELMKTYNTQPAILTASTACCRSRPTRWVSMPNSIRHLPPWFMTRGSISGMMPIGRPPS